MKKIYNIILTIPLENKIFKQFTIEDMWMENRHIKYLWHLYYRNKNQTVMRYLYTTARMPKIKKTDTIKCWWGCGATETLIH